MRQFENQVVLVTGAGNGIGRATAEAFAREGARVGVLDVTDAAGEETVAAIHETGGQARYAEVAEPVQFLASSKASLVAGHPLVVDGGYVAQ